MNSAYQFTNKLGYTHFIYVWEITEKSVYYIYADSDGNPKSNRRFRMSRNSFKDYKPLK